MEEKSSYLMEKVTQLEPAEAAEVIVSVMDKVKRQVYGLSKSTTKKLEKIEETKLWEKRAAELKDLVEKAKDQPGRDMHKLFFVRKDALTKLRYEAPSAITNLETGELLSTKCEIDKYTLKYNEDLLKKEEPKEEWKEEKARRRTLIEEMMEVNEDDSNEPITNQEFQECVFEIIDSKKDVYLDFIRSGPRFKMVVFALIQKIFLTGKVPDSFKKTMLMKLYKKGDQRMLSNYRFLHLKHWLPKVTEKVIMKRLTKKMNEATPELQLGNI